MVAAGGETGRGYDSLRPWMEGSLGIPVLYFHCRENGLLCSNINARL